MHKRSFHSFVDGNKKELKLGSFKSSYYINENEDCHIAVSAILASSVTLLTFEKLFNFANFNRTVDSETGINPN